jgi:4-hydroxybenzoate polyprenyltransferase
MSQKPLVVDLDGTLTYTDLLYESTLIFLRQHPLQFWKLLWWLIHGGKIHLKTQLLPYAPKDMDLLPYHLPFLDWLKKEKSTGRRIILCTASHLDLAKQVAKTIGIFDDVIASQELTNLAGKKKASLLVQNFGEKGFDYAGNSTTDMAVWKHANQVIVVNASCRLLKKLQKTFKVNDVFERPNNTLSNYWRLLRPHQWLKNILLLVPLLAAHQLPNSQNFFLFLLALISFCLCASSVYILNDLLDIENDRHHPTKSKRPLASGQVEIVKAGLLCTVLFLSSLGLAALVTPMFFLSLCTYGVLTTCYSFKLKRLLLIDCVCLALLYTLRIVAGSTVSSIPLSFWLLAFSVFLFLSLGFLKRYTELFLYQQSEKKSLSGRAYLTSDLPLIQQFGITSGYLAVLVLAFYLNSQDVVRLYTQPMWMWLGALITLFWISWMWIQGHRGLMHDDPVIFALKNRVSQWCGVLFVLTMLLGSV